MSVFATAPMRQFWVYILTSRSGVLYVGVTNDLERRMLEHKHKRVPGFTAKYNCDRLVYYEAFPDAWSAIAAEKRIKGWKRETKVALIESHNPPWKDLAADWEQPGQATRFASEAQQSTSNGSIRTSS